MNQEVLTTISIASLILWAIGAGYGYKYDRRKALAWTAGGIIIFGMFIAWLWINLERPPLSTVGETRILYSFFMPLVGSVIYARRRYKWILTFTTLMSAIFVGISMFNPDTFSKGLVPALQSPWFVPHVTLYILAYALLGTAAATAIYALCLRHNAGHETSICDSLTSAGTALLTLGMLTGALWAKEAWGHYWTWDPKETWAAITWFSYLSYIHLRHGYPRNIRIAFGVLIFSFLLLQMCWWGINILPSAKGQSLHIYG